MNEIFRTYELKNYSNDIKLNKLFPVIHEYRKTAKSISNLQWRNFFEKKKKFDKNLNIKGIESNLSERYKQTCQYQVVGTLKSYISNIKLRFVDKVVNSSVDEDTKIKLFYINKYEKWFHNEVKMKGKFIEDEILHLAKHVFKKLTRNKPSFKNMNLMLDNKVANISENNENSSFDYWLKISTLKAGKPISIPLKTNEFFESVGGVIKNSVQVNLRGSKIEFSLIKSVDIDEDYIMDKTTELGLDIGTVNLFATNRGDLLGKRAMSYLKKMDKIITKLQRNLRKQGINPNESERFVKLNKKVRAFLKNEINRIFNKLVKRHNPKKISVEKLNFQKSNLGKKNNRILNRFGKRYINEKLSSISEIKQIEVEEKNPAYTSQQCSNCNYTNEKNRKKRDEFKCLHCGNKTHADVQAARNIVVRSSDYNTLNKRKVFQKLSHEHDFWKDYRRYHFDDGVKRSRSSAKGDEISHQCPNPIN